MGRISEFLRKLLSYIRFVSCRYTKLCKIGTKTVTFGRFIKSKLSLNFESLSKRNRIFFFTAVGSRLKLFTYSVATYHFSLSIKLPQRPIITELLNQECTPKFKILFYTTFIEFLEFTYHKFSELSLEKKNNQWFEKKYSREIS